MAYQLHRISALVVEDNLPMLEIVKSLLVTFDVGQVVTATNGVDGFEKFCEYNNDIIIADWMMRPVDGIAFTRKVRNDKDSPNPYVPLILMTGFSERRRVFEARDAGVTEFLVKPFNARDLYKRLVQIIERPRQFVRAPEFFGPDRRRKKAGIYDGPWRRDEDLKDPDIMQHIRAEKLKAQETLRRVRQEEGLSKGDPFILQDEG